jgi:hypothetical protein
MIRGKDRHFPQRPQFLSQGQQAGSLNPVIVGNQNVHPQLTCLRLSLSWSVKHENIKKLI